MKIGSYGGTFNPIHLGHIHAAATAMEALALDKLLLVPDRVPPHKEVPADIPNPEHRLAMAAMAAEILGPRAETLDLEVRREGRSYTLDTLRAVRDMYPQAELWLLMGTDMFLSFHNWRAPEEMLTIAGLCAFGRSEKDGEELFAPQRQYLQQRFPGARVTTLVLPNLVDISSTELREKLARGEGEAYLAPAIYGYILREHLYGTTADLRALTLDQLRPVALSYLKAKRVPHVLGTEGEAARLAERWGADQELARRAALLHDCTKRLAKEEHLALLERCGVVLDPLTMNQEKLLHAPTGAMVAERVFGECPQVVSAIRWHTTGRADMTLLEKILYLADYIEPTRDFCDLTQIRRLAYEDLDQALLLGMDMAIDDLVARGKTVHPDSLCARDYLKGKQQ